MKIKYIPVFTNDIEKQVAFFTENLGFEVYGKKNLLPDREGILIKTNSPDLFIIVLTDPDQAYTRSQIIINSHDCLSDYHNLKMAGVVFFNEPHYLPMGLGAEFFDPSGNQYLLIEERSYNSPA
ncbi:MAG: VOC family protein [Bacteroidetes bacterium]|jgi:predicted enzyme related to lactoylglutathione lyase|nr:VOC family protein [Bacteroidota bacterium]